MHPQDIGAGRTGLAAFSEGVANMRAAHKHLSDTLSNFAKEAKDLGYEVLDRETAKQERAKAEARYIDERDYARKYQEQRDKINDEFNQKNLDIAAKNAATQASRVYAENKLTKQKENEAAMNNMLNAGAIVAGNSGEGASKEQRQVTYGVSKLLPNLPTQAPKPQVATKPNNIAQTNPHTRQ